MFKYHNAFLLMSIISYLIVLSHCWITEVIKGNDNDRIINSAVMTIIEQCDLGIQSIIVYGDHHNLSIFEALSELEIPVTKLLMSGLKMINASENFYDVQNQAIVLATDPHFDNAMKIIDIMFEWRCKKNCTIITVPLPYDNCANVGTNLQLLGRMSVNNGYYICIRKNVPLVFTYDFYGDTRPFGWTLVTQKTVRFNTWILYFRPYHEAEICKGFLFARTRISQNNSILLTINNNMFLHHNWNKLKDGFHGTEIKERFVEVKKVVDNLERLAGVKFMYYVTNGLSSSDNNLEFTFKRLLADIRFQISLLHEDKFYRYSFVPIYWDYYGILSHHRGLRTPLEKIAHFYGIWTISSLTVFSVLTFIVIWCKMRKNIAFAAFDIIRLLINSDIAVPIDTLSLKIFFCMIFLYFMVIHATFSGNLTKFLTIPQDRKNIDTVEDLKDSRVEAIYCHNLICQTDDTLRSLSEKIVQAYTFQNCTQLTVANPNSACVAAYETLQSFVITNESQSTLHISKKFAPFGSSYKYRKQFILSERFNKAFMYLNEIELSFYSRQISYIIRRWYALREAESEIEFRTITVEDLKFAFIFLIIGNSLSIVCFSMEILISRKKICVKIFDWVKHCKCRKEKSKPKKLFGLK